MPLSHAFSNQRKKFCIIIAIFLSLDNPFYSQNSLIVALQLLELPILCPPPVYLTPGLQSVSLQHHWHEEQLTCIFQKLILEVDAFILAQP